MSVAKQWRTDEGEGECLTLGLGGWIEDKVRFLQSFILIKTFFKFFFFIACLPTYLYHD